MDYEIWFSILTVCIIYVLYKIFYNSKSGLWKNQGIPELSGNLISAFYSMFKKNIFEIQNDTYKKHGRVYGTFQFGQPSLIVSDPELVKLVLIKDFNAFTDRMNKDAFKSSDEIVNNMVSVMEGEDWKRIRSIISPTFTTGKIKKMSHLIEECVNSLVKNFEANQHKIIEMKEYFGAYTMDVIARCAFGITLDSLNDPNNAFVKHAASIFKPAMNWRFLFYLILPKILTHRLKVHVFPEEAINFFEEASRKIIANRKIEKDKTHDDFLQLLIEAFEKDSHESNKTLSEIEIISQSFSFFIGGYETTTNTLSFVAYNLAIYPDVQKSLQKEIDDVIDNLGDKSLYDTIMNLPYMEAVISETLRVHTNLYRLDRVATRDCTLNNIFIPKGTIIGIPTASMHQDKEFFPKPEKFKPERFLPENKDQIKPYTYMPFGSGPRNCIAMRFALIELKYALFKVLREFDFIATEEAKKGLTYNKFVVLLQAKTIPLQVVKRKQNIHKI